MVTNVPILVHFKFQMHVKYQLAYRCFVHQLNKLEMRLSEIKHLCVRENRGTEGIC